MVFFECETESQQELRATQVPREVQERSRDEALVRYFKNATCDSTVESNAWIAGWNDRRVSRRMWSLDGVPEAWRAGSKAVALFESVEGYKSPRFTDVKLKYSNYPRYANRVV